MRRIAWTTVLLAVLFVGLTACKKEGSAGATLSLIPKDVTVVGGANLARFKESDVYKKLIQKHLQAAIPLADAELPGVASFLMEVSSVTVGANQLESAAPGVVVVLKHKDDWAPLLAKIVAHRKSKGKPDLTTQDHAGVKIYTNPKEPDLHVAFLSGGIAVGGALTLVKQSIDLSKGTGESVEKNAQLAALIAKTHSDHAFWAAGQVPSRMKAPVQTSTACGSLDLASGLAMDLTLTTPSEAEAKKMVDIALKAGAEGKAGMEMFGLGSVMKSIQWTAKGADAKLDIKLSQTQINDLIGRIEPLINQRLGSMLGGPTGQPTKKPPTTPPPR